MTEDNPIGIPKAHKYKSLTKYNMLMIDILGGSLDDLFKKLDKKFSLKTVLSLADQM